MTNSYNKETKKGYTNFKVFEYEDAPFADQKHDADDPPSEPELVEDGDVDDGEDSPF